MTAVSASSVAGHVAHGVLVQPSALIGPEVAVGRIAPGVEILSGSRITGAATSIGPGCRIGGEGPAVIEDCRLGRDVRFAAGYARDAVMLDGASVGAGAHIRPGTVLEEQASCAHSVGLKQTILMPWVTLGSLVNFCDCLMAGGTGASDHGEVGSSYVHFNFTPHQDKATASLIGDVPRGVLLDQPPVFLGGQGGLVGPVRIAFGTVVAAGTILRRDIESPGLLIRQAPPASSVGDVPYDRDRYGDVDRACRHTFRYAGSLHALAAWYRHVRLPFVGDDTFLTACCTGALAQFEIIARERARQLQKVAAAVAAHPGDYASHARLLALRGNLAGMLHLPGESPAPPDVLRRALEPRAPSHLERIRALPEAARQASVAWLDDIVNAVEQQWEDAR